MAAKVTFDPEHLTADLRAALMFFTRLPIPSAAPMEEGALARATWAAPMAGIVVGLVGALVYWIAWKFSLPPLPAAMLALAATVAVTGALHEDGLADVADGFGGGKTVERKLEIMRDSRIGTYGVCALILSFMLRASALAAIADPKLIAFALVAAHAASRATLPAFMTVVPPARTDGLSASAGTPPNESVGIAAAIGIIMLALMLGIGSGIIALIFVLLGFVVLWWLCERQVNGQTGDVLGTLQQTGEILILLTAAARM
jgi:adenosylcobinamide-GDP ribazoletransferase